MSRPRFSIAGLLVFILGATLGLAALTRPSCLCASVTFSLLLLSLTVAFIGAVYRRGHRRVFWTGYLACGSLYMVLSLAPWFDSHVSPRLITTAMLDLLYPRVPLLSSTTGVVNDPWKFWTGSPPDYSLAHPRVGFTLGTTDEFHGSRAGFNVATTDEFLLIGHSLFGLLVAVSGGLLARYFNEDRATSEP
jgi:hypothetical protein